MPRSARCSASSRWDQVESAPGGTAVAAAINLEPVLGGEPGSAERAGPLAKRRHPLGGEPFAPGADRVHVPVKGPCDGRVGCSLRCGQERLGPGDPPGWGGTALC
jgi:hypothetical protein